MMFPSVCSINNEKFYTVCQKTFILCFVFDGVKQLNKGVAPVGSAHLGFWSSVPVNTISNIVKSSSKESN